MAKTKITKRLLDRDDLPDRYYHDTELPGFGAYIGQSQISFFIQYRTGYGRKAQKKRMTIGKFGPMTIAQARKLAKETLGLAALGHDPSQERQSEAKKTTIAVVWDEYKKARPELKGIVTDQNRFDNHIKPYCGHKKPDELVPIDIDRLRVKLLKTHKPGTVRNVLELLRRIINFAGDKRLCPVPDFNIKLPKVDNKKTEDLTAEQLTALWKAIDKDTNIQAANFMKMVLYTGMRRGELFRLQWEHIDFDRGFLKLVDTKGGQTERIPLNDAARALLNEHPRIDDSPYVFPGRSGGQRVDINKQVGRIKERAGLPKGFRALHGLRHVFASTLASSGKVDMYTLQKLLTHKSPAMTQRYAHLRDEALQNAAQLAGDLMTERPEIKNRRKVG